MGDNLPINRLNDWVYQIGHKVTNKIVKINQKSFFDPPQMSMAHTILFDF